VTFAGHWALVVFGCGADCRGGFVADVRNGRIIDLPLGGEDYEGLWLLARPTSRLLKAWWIDTKNDENFFEHPMCVRQDYLLTGNHFKLLDESRHRGKNYRECFPDEK